MSIDRSLVGTSSDPQRHTHDGKDAILYALGVGATTAELDYLYEERGPKVLPTFAVVPAFAPMLDTLRRLKVDLKAVLHGEQKVVQRLPIPPRGELRTVATVDGVYDKGKAALVVITTRTRDQRDEPIFDTTWSIFVRGAGGFGGDRGPETAKADPPARAPDFEQVQATTDEQAALYRLSGDLNPLHIDPAVAQAAGFERPILHGLCTYGFAGRAVLRHACDGDPARFGSLAARFSGVVLPGDVLTTRGWRDGDRVVLQVVKQDGTVVLSNAVAEVTAARTR